MTAAPGAEPVYVAATLRRRLISLIYEALILAAVLLASAAPMVMLSSHWNHTAARFALQAWLLLICGAFYVRQWSGTGQTLPMKTWRLKIVAADGSAVRTIHAVGRYAAALLSVASLGLGFLWALLDRDRQFLHDRLAGTRIVMLA